MAGMKNQEGFTRFRGYACSWGKNKDQWVYGWVSFYLQNRHIHWRCPEGCEVSNEVKPKTIGMGSGLNDKKGTEIFDGDIVRLPNKEEVPVTFERGCFYTKTSGGDYRLYGWDRKLEIVGNIHNL